MGAKVLLFFLILFTIVQILENIVHIYAIEKCGEYVENGTCRHRNKKKAVLVF